MGGKVTKKRGMREVMERCDGNDMAPVVQVGGKDKGEVLP